MKFVSDRVRKYLAVAKDFCVHRVLHADDPPHRLALGIAVGMFVTFTPLIGIQMMVSVFLAWLLRANKVVGVPIVWISNPLTVIPIFTPCYVLGCKVLGVPVVLEVWQEISREWNALIADPGTRLGDKVRFWWERLIDVGWDSMLDFAGPLWVGCLLVAAVAGVVSYYISLFAIRQYRLARWGQLMPPRTTPKESIEDDSVTKDDTAQGGSAA
ncbi:MAG: DUF2062 domain-containing protein [bacterium]|nr:DUF2062 domain-containing protein [bacterium]